MLLKNNIQLQRYAALFGIGIFVILYSINARTTLIGDSLAHLYQAASLVYSGDYTLDEYKNTFIALNDGKLPYFIVESGGHLRSLYNYLPALILVPFFAVGRLILGEEFRYAVMMWGMIGKLAASLLILGAGIFLWKLLYRRVCKPISVLTLTAFWFGSPLWVLSIDYLQHNPLVFFKLAALYMLFRSEDSEKPYFFFGGLFLAFTFLSRYQNLLSVLMISGWVFWNNRRNKEIFKFFLGGFVMVPLTLLYHKAAFGGPFTQALFPYIAFNAPFLTTLILLFLNPSKGFFIHSPWGIFSIIPFITLIRKAKQQRPPNLAIACMLSVLPTLILYGKLNCWFGGWCWGYRYLIDILPEMVILFAFGTAYLWRFAAVRWGASALVTVSIMIQLLGVLTYDHEWHRIYDLGFGVHREWINQIRNNQIIFSARSGKIYIGSKPVQIFKNPYSPSGFYKAENWEGESVSWTAKKSHFLFVAKSESPTLDIFPSPAATENKPLNISIMVQGGYTKKASLPPNVWTRVALPGIPFQHSAIIDIETEETYLESSASIHRELGVALKTSHIIWE